MSRLRVLVVDDDPGILGLVAKALSLRGHEVHTASSPRQALDLASTMTCFDLLLTDVVMPEMSGPELARKIAENCPGTSIIIMSACVDLRELPSGVRFLNKPFLLADLYAIVEATSGLGAGSAAT